ncbi:phospholipase A and acyltransferase 1-like isoform X2 [Mercenaria mercenaria]|uniref:phospholipase A and acyltransferase 1-like isoform X2 n=1 Tax=Mercenaria mercenaria TaxID=6596 RepID=UPI00234E3EC9|nr:phospholipase A and acyltransferase 1-like isoform X2 [Mercenaria mercenaria]
MAFERGDIVAFPRIGYTHYGIYVGRGKIIHFDGSKDQKGADATVRIGDLHKVPGSSRKYICNKLDKDYKPFSPTKIVSNAESMLGYSKYNIIGNNCEHFAMWCRYGNAISEQSRNFVGALILTVFMIIMCLVFVYIKRHILGGKKMPKIFKSSRRDDILIK